MGPRRFSVVDRDRWNKGELDVTRRVQHNDLIRDSFTVYWRKSKLEVELRKPRHPKDRYLDEKEAFPSCTSCLPAGPRDRRSQESENLEERKAGRVHEEVSVSDPNLCI